MRHQWVGMMAWAGVLAGTAGVSLGAGAVIDLGHLNSSVHGISGAVVISANGQVVAGSQYNAAGDSQAFIWTATTGIQPLPLPGSDNATRVYGISGDGSVIVGRGQQTAQSIANAFMWTPTGGSVLLDGTGSSQATGVSVDGNTIIGSETGTGIGNVHWVTWSKDGTKIPFSNVSGVAYGTSANGSVIVGESSGIRPVYWTQQTGAVFLPLLPGGVWGEAVAVSGDGTTIIGYNSSPDYAIPPGLSANDIFAFRWTAAKGLEPLGSLVPTAIHDSVYPFCVNEDGSIIAGSDEKGGAFVWDELHGMRRVQDVLATADIDTQGWSDLSISGMSSDGLTLVGAGIHNGIVSNFLIAVPASVWVPEPTGIGLTMMAAGCLSLRQRPRQKR